MQSFSTEPLLIELDALQFEEEEEGPSYLSDLNSVPDFVDEAPVESRDVSFAESYLFSDIQPDSCVGAVEGSGQNFCMTFLKSCCITLSKSCNFISHRFPYRQS